MLTDLHKKAVSLLSENASALLTAGGVVGTVTTAVLTGRAASQATRKLIDRDADELAKPLGEREEIRRRDNLLLVWPLYIPPVLAGGATVGSIVMANRMSAQKAAALAAAYGLSERQLREYKEKVAEKITGPKNQAIHDELAQDRVNNTRGYQHVIMVEGEVLCFDQPTGRYFRSTMENIKKAVNATNQEILQHHYASASYFYEELELEPTTWTDDVGWNEMFELSYSTVTSPDGKPCIAIDFKVLPKPDFVPSSY